MAEQPIAFYFDASVQVAIAEQLKRKGIDAITARDIRKLRDSDPSHLRRATAQNRELVTHDDDFVKLARRGAAHAGIVFVPREHRNIGVVVKGLTAYWQAIDKDAARNLVWFLSPASDA